MIALEALARDRRVAADRAPCSASRDRRAPCRSCPAADSQPRLTKRRLHGLELQPRGEPGALEALLRSACRRRSSARLNADAAELQALEILRLVPSPMISSVLPPPMSTTRRLPGSAARCVRDAEVDQARLLDAGDDFDGMTERLARPLEERLLAPRPAQRVGADDAHLLACMSRRCAGRSARRQASARAGTPCRGAALRRARPPGAPSRAADR